MGEITLQCDKNNIHTCFYTCLQQKYFSAKIEKYFCIFVLQVLDSQIMKSGQLYLCCGKRKRDFSDNLH